MPPEAWGRRWTQVLDTFESGDEMSEERLGRELSAGAALQVQAWSLVLLAADGATWRAIMTSVDLMTASASSPRRSFSSSIASRVMTAVSV